MTKSAAWLVLAALASGCASTPETAEAPPAFPEERFLNLPYRSAPNGYTHVVKSPPGTMVFLSGAGGADREGNMPDDFATQAQNAFENLKAGLELAGATFDDVVKITYFLTDMDDLGELREVRARYLNMGAPPAASAVQTGLGGAMKLEVELIAVIPE